MKIKDFINEIDASFFTGVPDSQLKALCNYLMSTYGIDANHHIIAANEGNCVGIAAGYHMATKKVPVVYLQNSGEGNIINPVASLANTDVYGIPMLFIVGWRGEPGVHDEPQHVYQGKITLKLLEDMDIQSFVIDPETTVEELQNVMVEYKALFSKGQQAAFVIKKGALENDVSPKYKNDNKLVREEIIEHLIKFTGTDPIISTTGKTSRELFELREKHSQSHETDFLTVGGMGHNSSIALGVALNKPEKRVWCIDGDGALIMHMGAMATIGSVSPDNLVHIVINNEAHESVGGLPTVSGNVDWQLIAKGCGYKHRYSIDTYEELDNVLETVTKERELTFIEIKSGIGSRADLGRPTISAADNKKAFVNFLNK